MLVNRLVGHARRFRSEFLYTSIIGVVIGIFFSMFYPGQDGMEAMIDLVDQVPAFAALFGTLDANSKGWLLWISIIANMLLYFLMAISGIMIGSKIIPTVQEDSVELFLGSNPFPPRKMYIENSVSAITTQIVALIPLYLVIFVLTAFVHDSSDILGRISLTFAVALVFGLFFLGLTSMVSILRFSKNWGKIAGFGYLFYAFGIEILADNPEYERYADISINYFVRPTDALFDQFEWDPFFIVLGISLVFFVVGYWKVKSPDYIEKSGYTYSSRGFRNPLTSIGQYVVAPRAPLSRKFPLFMEQTRKDLPAVVIVIAFVLFQQGVIYFRLPAPEDLLVALEQSNSPAFSAFSQNHPLEESIVGFLVLKFYSVLWMFYGIILMFIATGIPTRDVRSETHDLLLANDLPPSKLIYSRIASMAVSFTLVVWITFLALRGYQSATTSEIDLSFNTQFGVFVVLWIHYLGMAIFIVAITMIPTISKGRSVGISVFIFFVMLSFIPFLDPSIEFLKYISYLSYFDPVGMVYEEVKFLPSFLISLGLFIVSCIFTWFVLGKRYKNTDFR